MTAVATIPEILNAEELRQMDAYWRACNYLCAGMIYLYDNPLLREPLKPEHIKQRLLGHWGSDPGQTFLWVHLNRLIRKYDLNMIYICGPAMALRRCCRMPGWKAPTPKSIRTKARTSKECASSSGNSPFLAASAVTARRKHQDRSTKVASSATVSPTLSVRPSTIPI